MTPEQKLIARDISRMVNSRVQTTLRDGLLLLETDEQREDVMLGVVREAMAAYCAAIMIKRRLPLMEIYDEAMGNLHRSLRDS